MCENIPLELMNLNLILLLDLNNNHLSTSDPALIAWLNTHNPGWDTTQTPCPKKGINCARVTDIPSTECEALVALYNNTDGDKWLEKRGWNVTIHPCSWFGVTCKDMRVDKLELSSNNLTGAIPPAVENLAGLTTLDLSYNQINNNVIPPELGNLVALKTLNLSHNQLGDKNWTTGNEISADLGLLANLQVLDLSYNELHGSIPPELGDLLKLKNLDLSYNELSDSVPADLGDLKKLINLDLSNNKLDGSISGDLGKMKKLKYLNLSNNSFTDPIPAQLGKLKKLRVLDMSNNGFTGSIPNEFQNLKKLEVLDLSFNKLSGSIPKPWGKKLAKLKEFFLNNNGLCGDIPTTLVGMTAIKSSDFEFNHLELPNDKPLKDWLKGHDSAWKNTQSPCYANNLIVDFGPTAYPSFTGPFKTGIWELIGIKDRDNDDLVDSDQWVQISTVSSIRKNDIYDDMVAINLMGSIQNELIVDFPSPTNIWLLDPWPDSLFTLDLDDSGAKAALATGDIDGNGLGDVLFDTEIGELWAWTNSKGIDENEFWERLSSVSPTILAMGDIDGSGEDDVIAYFATAGTAPDPNAAGIWALMNNKKNSQDQAKWTSFRRTI
ncbi:MAG: leucine-rich repeat domain-containing protein [Pseudomonadota bacterium]